MGVVRFPVYLNYIEAGLIELLRSIGYDSGQVLQERQIAFPVRELTCKYHKPARFDEILDVVSRITSIGTTSLVTGSQVLRASELLMECTSVRVCASVKTGQKIPLEEAFKHLPHRV
jgi:acyl-CoA thioester hydrolase